MVLFVDHNKLETINLFKLSSQTLSSSSSDSSSSESKSERLFKNIKIKNTFTLTPECENIMSIVHHLTC